MTDFITIFIILSIIGAPMLVVFVCVAEGAKEKLCKGLIILGIWLVLSLALLLNKNENSEKWNNGFCQCGAHWELETVTSRAGTKTKYYSCPNCYTEIELNY